MSVLIPTFRDSMFLVGGVLLAVAVPQVFKAGAAMIAWVKSKFAKTPQE